MLRVGDRTPPGEGVSLGDSRCVHQPCLTAWRSLSPFLALKKKKKTLQLLWLCCAQGPSPSSPAHLPSLPAFSGAQLTLVQGWF